MLAERIYAGCDGKDGLKDGVIDDPRRCGFVPSRDLRRCPDGADGSDCFTLKQIQALERIYNDVSAGGKRLFPGWPVGAETAGPNGRSGWMGWFIADTGRSIQVNFAETFFRYFAFPEKDPTYDLSRVNFDTDPARLEWIHRVLDATDSDLSSFKAADGKLLMYFGWADPALNAMMGLEYYEEVVRRMGAETSDFFRLFMVPGMFHCGGGVGVGTFDWLSSLVQWVEKGQPPDRIVGSRILEGKVVRTRPVCPYPQVARYSGTGSPDDAVNFKCERPQ
jgi:feruloyl esterase